MAKQNARTLETEFSIRLPKKLAGKKLVVVEAEEFLRLKKRLGEVEDALGKISRGNAAYRERRTKVVKSLSELGR
jgi:hypothetical protein